MNLLKKIILLFITVYIGYVMYAYIYFFATISSKAQVPITPTPSPRVSFCLTGLKTISYHDRCGKRQNNIFKRAKFLCTDNTRGEFRSKNCLTEAAFSKAALQSCLSLSACPILSPTPTPSFNSSPIITTSFLPSGNIGSLYSANITAIDKDSDLLTMTIAGLPPGIEQGPCTVKPEPTITYLNNSESMPPWSGSYKTCIISGIPKQGGYFKIGVSVSDNINTAVFKSLSLTINPPWVCPSPPVCRGGYLLYGDPAPGSKSMCPLYQCIYPSSSPSPNYVIPN